MNHEGMNTPPPASKTATKLAPSTASPGDVALAVGVSPEAGASTSAAGNNDINASTALSSSSPQHWSGSPLKMVLFNKKKGEHDDSPPPRGGGHDDDDDDAPPLDVGGRLINAFEKGMQFALKANEMTNKGLEDAKNSKAFARGREMMQRAEERQEQVQDMWEKLAMGISPFEKEDKEGAESPEERRRNKRDLYDKAGIRFYKPASDPARRERFYMRNFHLNYQPSTDGMSHVRGTGALDLPKEKQRRNFGPRALVKPRRHYVEYVDSCATVVSRHHFVQEIGEGVMPKTRTEKVLYALGKMWDSYVTSIGGRYREGRFTSAVFYEEFRTRAARKGKGTHFRWPGRFILSLDDKGMDRWLEEECIEIG